MKTILFVTHNLTVGGTEVIVSKLAGYFSSSYNVEILVLDQMGSISDRLVEKGVKVHYLNRSNGWKLKNFTAFFKIVRLVRPDIIHAHQYSSLFFSAVSKLFFITKAKLIFTEHGRHYPDKVSLKRKVVNQLLFLTVNKATAVSCFTKDALKRNEWLRNKVEIIYNGIKISSLPEVDIHKECNISKTTRTIAYVGSLREVKNPLLLLEAFNKVKNKEDIHLVYIGDGPLRNKIEKRISEYKLDEKVSMLGEKFPATEYIRKSTVFVQSSYSEANSLALLEAQALGVPSIVTKVGGSAEVIADNNGLLVKSNDVEDLKDSIEKLLSDKDLYDKISSSSKVVFNERFTEEKMLSNYQKLFNSL